jgi:hypothetical protein
MKFILHLIPGARENDSVTKLSVTGVTQGSPYDHFSSSIENVAKTLDDGSCAKAGRIQWVGIPV